MLADEDTYQTPTDLVLDALESHRCYASPDGIDEVAPCPCHPNTGLELRVSTQADESVSLHCNNGCSSIEILAAIGLNEWDVKALAASSRPCDCESEASGLQFLDWRDRKLLADDEPVIVWANDSQDISRTVEATWGDIEGDFVESRLGRLRIERVYRTADQPIHEEELFPQYPRALRDSPLPPRPEAMCAERSNRWEMQLRCGWTEYWRVRGAQKMAESLGVTTRSILRLKASDGDGKWLLPERDAWGGITGLAVRYKNPWRDERSKKLVTKGFIPGGKRGLYYDDEWDQGHGPIVMPEGFSDSAACHTMGLSTIGRSSATAGGPHLLDLIEGREIKRRLIVIADRDYNEETEKWVGREGARRAAELLAVNLQREVLVALPPGQFKDTRDWLRYYCDGDLSSRKLAAARREYVRHLLRTTEVIKPGPRYELHQDDREVLELAEWRRQMRTARVASVAQPGHYADQSPTGAGKSYADRALIQEAIAQDKRLLLAVPTHANCTEEVGQLADAGIEAVAYPELSRYMCRNHRHASTAVASGLNLTRAVCVGCAAMHDESCLYRQQLQAASAAQVAVCTTVRLGLDRSVSAERDVISVHEVADSAIRDQYVLAGPEIKEVRQVLHSLLDAILPYDQSERELERTQESRDYIEGLARICDVLLVSLQQGKPSEDYTALEMPQGYWMKFAGEWLDDANLLDSLREAYAERGILRPDKRIDGNTLRGLLMIAHGGSWEIMNYPFDTGKQRRRQAKVIVQRRLQFKPDQTWWWQDATSDLDQLRLLLGQPVADMTPDGRLERAQTVEVVPVDISRKTTVQKVADAIRMTAITTGCQRLGVIGFKTHIDKLQDESRETLIPEIRERIHMWSYYGAGLDRGSNQWLECDRILILGTPRIGDDPIREELWREGNRKAAQTCEPGWGDYTWEARIAGNETEVVIVAGRSYLNDNWHQASLRLTRAAMRQAVGRARPILDCGVPATIWTTEALSEYPVRPDPIPHTAVIDVVQAIWCANVAQLREQPKRGVTFDESGKVWISGAEIGRRLGRDRGTASRVLQAAEDMELVRKSQQSRGGWSLGSRVRQPACGGS